MDIADSAILSSTSPRFTSVLNVICKRHATWLGGVWDTPEDQILVMFDTVDQAQVVAGPGTWEMFRLLGNGVVWKFCMLADTDPLSLGGGCAGCTYRIAVQRNQIRTAVFNAKKALYVF